MVNKSKLSRRHSSAHTSKDQDKDKKCESEKVENDSKSRRNGTKKKVVCSSVEAKQDFDTKTSICSSKDSNQRNTSDKNEPSRNKDKNQKKGSNTKVIGSDLKIVKGSCSDTRSSKICKIGNERIRKKISGKDSAQDESSRKTNVEAPKLGVGSSARAKMKPSRNNECDFSKIESMIFEDHIDKEFPDKRRIASERGKRKESKHSDVKNKINRPRELTKTDRKSSKISSKVSQKCKEKPANKGRKSKNSGSIKKKTGSERPSDSDGSDWEEVDEPCEVSELEALLGNSQEDNLLPSKSVKIELDAPDVLLWGMKKRKKKRTEEEMIEEYLRKHLNRSIKEVHENMHKTHLLCLFAHGQCVNKALNSEILLGSALSLITDKNVYPPKRLDMTYLEKFVNWFSRKIKVKIQDLKSDYWSSPLEVLMVKRFENKTAFSNRELVYMFVVMSRALGMNVRLVLSLQPMSWKPSTEALIKRLKKEEESSKCSSDAASCSKSGTSYEAESQVRVEKKEIKNSKKNLSSDSNVEVQMKKKPSSKGILSVGKSSKTKSKRSSSLSDGNDSDFDPFPKVKKGPKVISKKRKSNESIGDKKRKLNGSNDDKEKKKRKKEPLIEWAEIYVEEEEKWICVDIIQSKIHCITEIETQTPTTSAYITAYNANLNVKDVTRRYITSWLSNENKMRCCSRWWQKTLQPFRGKQSPQDKEEDDAMDQNLCQQPFPKTIGEYKNHPLYALQRHLLKFEAIYPPDEGPVGYIKGEPVFQRSSVYTLRSRDTWLKEAKTVRVGEEPYKIVKAKPKWDRNTCQIIKDRPLEVFGEWQVEDYEPPVASGGKVPRNEYGNVELFKPSMLPKGCVHLQIPGLNRVARKLNIDCASAMVGFDFHSGWTHPVYEGFVVCEEFKDILLDAWQEDQVEQARRAEEKRQKRVYDNWKRLIHGMMVKERVRQTYGNALPPKDKDGQAKIKTPDEKECQSKGKIKIKGEHKNTKVTQKDIDDARPSHVTHKVNTLNIDLTSNVVDMAKESRERTMNGNNSVNAKAKREKNESSQPLPTKEGNIEGSSEEETDEEEKREKIRAVLQWGSKDVTTNPNLSDDSDIEDDSRPSCSKSSSLNYVVHANKSFRINEKKKKTKRKNENHSESSSSATSYSTTPEPNADDIIDLKPRRLSRRSTKNMYAESDDNEGDISIDESDVEDKTYNPLKEREKTTLNLSESD